MVYDDATVEEIHSTVSCACREYGSYFTTILIMDQDNRFVRSNAIGTHAMRMKSVRNEVPFVTSHKNVLHHSTDTKRLENLTEVNLPYL